MQKRIKITKNHCKKLLPKRNKLSHKGVNGHVLIIGGGVGFIGAGLLAALAATRSGAGYTHLMTDSSRYPWLKFPDFIVHELSASLPKTFQPDSVGMGPGAGVNKNTEKLLNTLIKKRFKKVVLDADALTVLSKRQRKLPETWILTPHDGELARLLNVKTIEIKLNRRECLLKAQAIYGCIILLKGAETLICDQFHICSITSGTPALAKAGTGDVLLGMITAFNAQLNNSFDAAVLGAYLHGLTSNHWIQEGNDVISMRPLDLIERLPKVISSLRS